MSIVAPFGPWEPAQPAEVAGLFSGMPCPWWIAAGHAIVARTRVVHQTPADDKGKEISLLATFNV